VVGTVVEVSVNFTESGTISLVVFTAKLATGEMGGAIAVTVAVPLEY